MVFTGHSQNISMDTNTVINQALARHGQAGVDPLSSRATSRLTNKSRSVFMHTSEVTKGYVHTLSHTLANITPTSYHHMLILNDTLVIFTHHILSSSGNSTR